MCGGGGGKKQKAPEPAPAKPVHEGYIYENGATRTFANVQAQKQSTDTQMSTFGSELGGGES